MNRILKVVTPFMAWLPIGLTLLGCGSGGSLANSAPNKTATASSFFVLQAPTTSAGGSVLSFSATANGSAMPAGELTLPPTFHIVESVTTDGAGQIYVGGRDLSVKPQILQYAPGASGSASPVRTLSFGSLSYANPGEMAVDASGALYVGADAAVVIFDSANGTSPTRIIAGSQTQNVEINGIAVDTQGNIYVTNGFSGPGSVLVFAASANGNVAPVRTITGVVGASFFSPYGIAIDAIGNLYVSSPTAAGPQAVYELLSSSTGNTVPVKTIIGSATGFGANQGISALAVDGMDNLITVVITPNPTGSPFPNQPSIEVFAPSATANAAPQSAFTSSQWTSPGYGQIGIF